MQVGVLEVSSGRENRVRLSVWDGFRCALVADQLDLAFASCEDTGGHANTSGRRDGDPPGVGHRSVRWTKVVRRRCERGDSR